MKTSRITITWLMVIFCAQLHTHAQSTNVNVWAWGDNSYGQCDIPTDLTNVVAISAGSEHALALRVDGTVRAWGASMFGQTNDPHLSDVIAISAGSGFNLALRANRTVFAWGDNNDGACNVPSGLSNVVAISAATGCLALTSSGTVVGWGASGPTFFSQQVPADLTNVIAISACIDHGLALRSDGTVTKWDGSSYTNRLAVTNVVAISAGSHDLLLIADGTVYTADAGASSNFTITNLPNVVSISAGGLHNLVINNAGVVIAFGDDSYGECDVPPNLPNAILASASGRNSPVDTPYSLVLVNPNQAGAPPTILAPPQSQTIAIGSTAYLFVAAVGYLPLSYQWYFGTNALAGQTNSVLILTNAGPNQSGSYSVVVSNPAGSTPSAAASLSVLPALDIHMVPAISIIGEAGFRYQLNYRNVIGPTNSWTPLATITVTNNPQFYFDVSAIGQPQRFYQLVQLP